MHCRMFSSISGPYPLDTSTSNLAVTTKMWPDMANCPLEGRTTPGENHWLIEMSRLTLSVMCLAQSPSLPHTALWMINNSVFTHRCVCLPSTHICLDGDSMDCPVWWGICQSSCSVCPSLRSGPVASGPSPRSLDVHLQDSWGPWCWFTSTAPLRKVLLAPATRAQSSLASQPPKGSASSLSVSLASFPHTSLFDF